MSTLFGKNFKNTDFHIDITKKICYHIRVLVLYYYMRSFLEYSQQKYQVYANNAISNTFQKHNLIRRNISPFGEDTRRASMRNTNFKKIRRLIEVVTTRRSWKFVGQSEDKTLKPLENTDYFATAKIAKPPTSNALSNTFQNYNLIRRNIEAVTTRRSWKPFAQKARGFESLFLRHFYPWKSRIFKGFFYLFSCFFMGDSTWGSTLMKNYSHFLKVFKMPKSLDT